MMNMHRYIVSVVLMLGIVGFFLGFYHYAAQAAVGLTIRPIKISHTIESGESVSGVITLKNASDRAVRVEVKVEDFIPSAGAQGYQFVGRAKGVTTVRDWITVDVEQPFVFEKGQERGMPYTITAPPDAEPGSHFGVAFFKASDLEAEKTGLKVGTQVGVLIFVTVPGNFLQKGEVLDFSAPKFITGGPVKFTIKFENTGTVHFEPKGEVSITNIFGKEVGRVPIAGRAVLPTGVDNLSAKWNVSGFLLGRYRADVNILDGEGNVLTTDSITFYAFPVWYILGFLITVLVLFFGIKFLRNRVTISISTK